MTNEMIEYFEYLLDCDYSDWEALDAVELKFWEYFHEGEE